MQSERPSPQWFFHLRFIVFFGQLLMLAVSSQLLGIELPLVKLSLLVCLIPASHAALFYSSIKREHWPAILLVVDTLILTGALALSGGAANPFSIVYLVHVVLAAVILSKAWTWVIAVLSSLCFSSLFLIPSDGGMHHHHGGGELSLHLYGMLASYILVAGLVAYFLTKILDELREYQSKLSSLKSSQEKLAAIAAISANAAHEINTPLSTIELIVHELNNSLSPKDVDTIEDLKLLKSQTARCKSIIDKLCTDYGNVSGDTPTAINSEQFQTALSQSLEGQTGVAFKLVETKESSFIPIEPLLIAAKALVTNALDAHTDAGVKEPVNITFAFDSETAEITIQDYGRGITAEALGNIGSPFFTTKTDGMGLGIYIAKLIAQQLGGEVLISSTESGTTAVLKVPSVLSMTEAA